MMSLAWPIEGIAQSPPKSKLEGMWSDPPVTIVARFCASWCTDAGIERLNALLDNPANDGKPVAQLSAEASTYQNDTYIKSRMTPAALASFPLDPADDPGLLKCEPWGLARQMFAPHQLQIRRLGNDRVELHYGEWDARRTVYMDGRQPPAGQAPSSSRSLGRTLGGGHARCRDSRRGGQPDHVARQAQRPAARRRALHPLRRRRDAAPDGHDHRPVEPSRAAGDQTQLALGPTSIIAPYDECKPPIAVKRGVAP